jgi:transcription antitermination factor NusG
MKGDDTSGTESYMDHVANAASFEAFNRHEADPLLSAETLDENSSLIDFKAFAQEYPEKLFPLLEKLRPEFQEFFIEYYLLEKSQSFIGKTHGQIQTRVWQNLRIIEQTIGSLILLGTNPGAPILRPVLTKAGLETTQYGSLTFMILKYAENQSYANVAMRVGAPVPAIRKIFRPAITALLADKNVQAVAVGAYLRGLTHQASLTGAGLSKRCVARTKRVKTLRFTAPPSDDSPLISFGAVSSLRDTPWCMLEISSEHRMTQIYPLLRAQGKRVFGKKAAQIFAPVNAEGELAFGYIFARSVSSALVRALTRIRGISEMATICDAEGTFIRAVTISDNEVQAVINKHNPSKKARARVGDFVEILTGPAARYCGTVIEKDSTSKNEEQLTVEVNFPTGRRFLVVADATCVKLLPNIPKAQRRFWGEPADLR